MAPAGSRNGMPTTEACLMPLAWRRMSASPALFISGDRCGPSKIDRGRRSQKSQHASASHNTGMFYDTEKNDHGLPRDPFKAIVAPRPIGWVTSMSARGEINLAPYSFFNAVSDRPPIVL